ncbi:protein PF14_0175-like isoform X2 [Cotesia glomerata]|uniref:protein PF14_0175-like isoform X2 n=1 Tax=Cotesia glomerata TaxID=32391 RepID=UPI001D0040DF|nr:protein PF14_0175-like isoform X2 [Cotesia glomerata]
MDEKEEGEISLEDVSSSEDLSINNHRKKKSRSRKIKLKNNMNDKRAWGKENRKFSNGFIGTEHRTLLNQEDSKNGLTPISSGEEIEYVSVPGSSQQIEIKTGQKKRRKKKKKKKAGPRMLTMDDLESDVVSDFRPDDKSFISTQPMTYASAPIIYNEVRETITITTTNHQSRSQKSTRQHYSSPVRSHRSPPENPRSPSSRRRSPRKFLPPGKPSTSSSVPTKHCSHKTLYQNKRHDEAYTSSLLKKVKEYDTTAVIPARQNRYKESSLKEKLNNMTKLHSDFKGGDNNNSKDNNNESIKIENLDDEDLDTLRRLALDTQQSRQDEDEQQQNSNNNNDNNSTNSDNTQTVLFNDSNHNVEELQLRAQALKTAVMNKCKNKGLFIKKRDKVIKDEATYNDSLLNDVIENIEENSAYSPGAFSVHYNKGSDVADMELDSDVEREKINSQAYSPYSPTDEVGDTFGDSYLTTDLLEDNKNQEMLDLEAPYSPSDIPASKLASPKSNQYNYPISDSDKSYLPNTSNFMDYNVVPTLSVHMPLNNVELNNISTLYGSLNVSSLNLSPLEQLNNSMLGNKNLSNNNKVLEPTEQVKFNETVVNSSARRAAKKDALYDEVLRDLEEDYGPIIRENEINNTVNVTSKLVPAPILRINKHLQKTLPLKQVDNPVKVFKSAEMKPVDINNQFVKTNTTFKPIKIPQPVKKSLASTSAEAFDSSIDESTTNCSNITPDDSSNNVTEKESVTTSDQVKRKPGRPKTPSKKITTTTVATNKNSKVTCNKAKTLTDKNINKKEQKTDRLNDETGKSESIKELSIITNKLDNNCKIDQILKQKKDSLLGKVSKIKNTKKPESLASTSETNDNKRRSSFEEEELRALALASLSKRLKPSGSSNKDSNSKESATNNVRFVKNNAQKPAMSKTITPSDGIPSTSSGITSNNNKKRPISADSQGPPKKIIKKSIKPTERVPKAIQSIIPQKFVQNKKKVPTLVPQSNPVVNNNNNSNINTVNKTNDPIDSLTSKITSTKKIQRMVINLGEDSDTDSEFEQLASVCRSNFKIPATRSNNPLTVPDTDFEKRLEDLLRSQREKTESSASKSSATTNSSDFSKTPQAMRHMPPDKLEEYRRLKQRAAELEKSITNDKRKRNPDKPNSAVKPTEAIPNPTKSLPKKIIKPGVEKTSSFVNAASTSTSVSAKTLSADKSISFSINNDISNTNSNSELSSKREENRLKVLANCSQEILKIIPKTNRKINLIRKANDNLNDERTDETIAQNVNVNVKSSDEIIEAIGTTASSDSFEYMHDSVIESFIIEEEKVDPNIIASISESHVVKNNSNVINWPRVSADDLSGNNKFDKLVIQISNTRDIDVLPRRQVNVIKKDQDKKSEPVKPQEKVAGPTLRILTADQVNMRGKVAAPTLRILTADQLNMRTDQSVTIETTTTMTTATVTGITETVTSSQERKHDNVMLNYNKKILHTCDNNNLINEMTIEEEEENKFDASIVVISESLNSDNRTNISELSIDNSSQVSKNDTVNNTVNTATGTSSESTESPSERINAEIKIVIDDYKLLSSEEQQSKLTTMESKFTEKKQMELDAYNILTENLQELETERQIQLDLSTQVKRLRAELKLAEERLKVQQEKLTGISGKIMTNKNFVNDRRNECNNHARICTEMGLIVVGKDYKIPPVGNQLSREAMKEVANRIKRLRKKAGSVDIGNNSDQQSNDDQSSVSSKDTCNTDDLYNLKINNQLNEQLGEVKIENSTEPLQVNLLSNEKDSTNVTNTVTSVDGQSGNDKTIVIKTENVENDRTETTSGTSNSRPEKEINNSNNNKKNNPEGIETEVAVKQEIIDIELESLPVDSEFTISYPNLESELNQIEMECIAKNEQDDLNELESRLTPIDPTLPEESYPMTEPMQQDDNINSIEPKTENDNDNNLTLPVFTNAPPVNDISSLIQPTVQTSQLSSSSGGNSSVDITDSLSKILGDNLSTRRKECEKKIKLSQPVKSYESILPALNPTRNLDPNAVLCPFELKGTCKDDACTYAHLNHRSTT